MDKERRKQTRRMGKAMDNDDREIIKGICYSVLPCSTNSTCKEMVGVKKTVEKIDTRTWVILATIILGTVIQIALRIG